MKHITTLSLFTLHYSLFSLALLASVPATWDVELTAQPPQVFTLQRPRGETYELEAVLKDHGKPFAPAITNACIYWQTNGMDNLYWSAPASVSNSVLRATWLPSMDPGATTVRGYIGDPGHIYAAAFQFRFIASPGALPNELPLPQKVIDFAKVTVLNPPWSGGGGGGGVDTNAVRDIIHKTVDGSARTLPPYLHYLEIDATYPDAADEWYAQADYSHGSCSSVRDGNTLSRNYDWNFDFMPEFVVRVPAGSGRFASIAVCNVGTNLTEADVVSGKWSKWYKALPGHSVDGINENGVAVNVNVVSGDPHPAWPTNGTIHCLGAVRWVLDNATNAASAASVLASEAYFPSRWQQNFHWMIADERETWIVENGSASNVAGRAVMTNFRLYPTRDTTGDGQERYDALASGENITSQWWTLTYAPTGYRASDLQGLDTNLLFRAWAATPKESHRGETFGGESWWQTCHTSIYDITNRTLLIAVQENPDWYVFVVPGGTGVSSVQIREIVEPMIGAATNGLPEQIAALQDGKRDLTNRVVYAEFSPWVATPALPNWYSIQWIEDSHGWAPVYFDQAAGTFSIAGAPKGSLSSTELTWVGGGEWSRDYDMTIRRTNTPTPTDDNFATESQMMDALTAKVDKSALAPVFQGGELYAIGDRVIRGEKLFRCKTAITEPAGWQPSNWEEIKVIGKLRDKDDNTCHKTEFTEWTNDIGPEWTLEDLQLTPDAPHFWQIYNNGSYYHSATAKTYHENDVSLTWRAISDWDKDFDITFTRSAVCTDGKKFTTSDFVDGKVSSAISTNNPAFVSAVRGISPPPSSTIRIYDYVRKCWWIGSMVNGVINWEVE